MPLELEAPVEVVIQPEVKKTFNSILVTAHYVDNENTKIIVLYKKLLNGIVVIENQQHEILGQRFLDIVMAMPSPGKNRYNDIKDLLYAELATALGISGNVV